MCCARERTTPSPHTPPRPPPPAPRPPPPAPPTPTPPAMRSSLADSKMSCSVSASSLERSVMMSSLPGWGVGDGMGGGRGGGVGWGGVGWGVGWGLGWGVFKRAVQGSVHAAAPPPGPTARARLTCALEHLLQVGHRHAQRAVAVASEELKPVGAQQHRDQAHLVGGRGRVLWGRQCRGRRGAGARAARCSGCGARRARGAPGSPGGRLLGRPSAPGRPLTWDESMACRGGGRARAGGGTVGGRGGRRRSPQCGVPHANGPVQPLPRSRGHPTPLPPALICPCGCSPGWPPSPGP
jgi:hypothetical protein